MAAAVEAAREALIEMVAEADEKLMEKFFEAGTLTDEELVAGPARGDASPAKLFPLVCTSALPTSACRSCSTRSSPTCRRRPIGRSTGVGKDGDRGLASADEKAPAAAFVWKTIADPFAGRITMFRVVSGIAQGRLDASTTRRATRRSGSATCCCCRARRRRHVPEIKAGDLGAVAKLKDTLTNDTLGDKSDRLHASRRSRFPSRCSRTRSSRRAAATKTRSARRCTGSRKRIRRSATAAIRRRRSCCSQARASCTSRSRSRS